MCRTLTALTHANVMEGYWGCIYTVLGRKKEQLYCCTILHKKEEFLKLIYNSIFTPKALNCGNNPGPVRGDSICDRQKAKHRIAAK